MLFPNFSMNKPELEFQEIPLTEPLDRFYVFQKVVMHYYDAIVE